MIYDDFSLDFSWDLTIKHSTTPQKKLSENFRRPGNSGDTQKSNAKTSWWQRQPNLPHDHHLYAWQLWDGPSVFNYMISMVIFWDHFRHLHVFRILQLIPSEWISSAKKYQFPSYIPMQKHEKNTILDGLFLPCWIPHLNSQ